MAYKDDTKILDIYTLQRISFSGGGMRSEYLSLSDYSNFYSYTTVVG